MKQVVITLFLVSAILNAGLIMGYIKVGSPEKLAEVAYNDTQRAMMSALVEDVQ